MAAPLGHNRKNQGLGKWIALLAVLVLIGLAAVLIGQPIREAKRTEQALIDRYGYADSFVPPPDGSIPPERMEAFLRVREQVYENCPEFQSRVGDLYQLDSPDHDSTGPPAVPARGGLSGIKRMISFGPAFLRFMETRNHALLAEEMGLGEYLYIYILAYAGQIRRVDETRFGGIEQAYVGARAREEMIRILRNQLETLSTADAPAGDLDLAADLQDQIAGLSGGRHALPWPGGLPPAITASLKPYAKPLAQLYCEGIAKIELMQKNRGLNVRN